MPGTGWLRVTCESSIHTHVSWHYHKACSSPITLPQWTHYPNQNVYDWSQREPTTKGIHI